MILVFLCTFILLLVIVVLLSTMSIRTEKLELSNCNKSGKLQYDYDIYFELLFLNKIKILSIKIDKKKLNKLKVKQKMQNIDFKKMKKDMPKKEEIKDIVKKLDLEIDTFKLKLKIGTEDVIVTSAIVSILASIIGIVLAKVIKEYKEEKYEYEIYPIYQNRNQILLNLNCIIKVKMVHIIFIIYLLLKKRRVGKNERTSNRGTYDYSYE